ncbi:TMV resistance protein N-like [Rhodamnia argentea]|uniref:TMV resistance protein N-like n=1 Tax=Rhodamnia argentea TaxID=178133 RepID=A0ABM3HXX1_9MYRT|nr:TMV resistance protein N-like [Rhodamnia argentea]
MCFLKYKVPKTQLTTISLLGNPNRGILFLDINREIGSRVIEEVTMARGLVSGRSFAVLVGSILLSVLARKFVNGNKKSTRRKADDTGASSPSATLAGSDNYDVFLSFSGKDTRKTFVDHLYYSLVDAGIRVFRDDNELHEGEKIGPNLLQAIKNSKISIPIFSRNFASSKWCLQELLQMTECMKSIGQVVLPIFYRVEPAHVRYQIESFEKTFSRLSRKYLEEDVAKWKQALQEVASLKGWESERTANGHEGELVKMVVRKVLRELKKAFQLLVPEQLVGIDNAVEDILRLLDNDPSATQIVGIHGMGGIGKTTLAKVVYNKLSHQFHHRSFIADIRESTRRKGISCLQNQLIFDILKMNDQVSNIDEGIRIMESRFKCKKVLLLLDDLDDNDRIKAFVGKHDWFENGSRIIITTRIRSVLDDVNCKYELEGIAEDKSLILFSRHAFPRDSPPCEFESLSRAVVSTAEGLPLALEVVGSFLYGRNQGFWEDALKKLKEVPHIKVQEKLRISYDAPNYEEQQIFLDIACFFYGSEIIFMSRMWEACNFLPNMGIETLRLMSLVKIGDNGKLIMHDQLIDLGREIVRQEDYNTPMNRSRVWIHEEALEVLQRNKGKEKDRVQALCFDENDSHVELTTEQIETLPNLRLLIVDNATLIGDSKGLLPQLRCLVWKKCPASVVTSFHLEKLVVLYLSECDISEYWEGWSHLKVATQLKVLALVDCHCLKVSPDLSAFQNLETLTFEGCHNLKQIHPSIGEVKGLVHLFFHRCEKLQKLPQGIGKLEELERLCICKTAIEEIPPCIASLKKLEKLVASDCKSLIGLPDSIGKLERLTELDLSCSFIYELPESIGDLKSLKILNIAHCENLRSLPSTISKLGSLELLDATKCRLLGGEIHIDGLSSLKILRLSWTYVSGLFDTFNKLSRPEKLEELDATNCERLGGEIPIDRLSSLKILRLRSTGVSGFSDEFDKLSRLEELDLRDCKMLQSLPQSISKLPSLQHLDLRRCDNLQSLPELPPCLTSLGVTCRHRTLPQLSRLIHLKVLKVVGCRLLESLPVLPSGLFKLSVQYCDELKELPSLSSMEFLSKLSIKSCSELTEIKGLEALKYLAELTVSSCGKLSNLDGLEHLESLRFLGLRKFFKSDYALCLVEDDIVQVGGLDRLKNLEELQIWDCQSLVRPDLSQLTHLKGLSLCGCHNLVEIKGLERLKDLELLHIKRCRSIEALPDPSCFDNLKDLTIERGWKLQDREWIKWQMWKK